MYRIENQTFGDSKRFFEIFRGIPYNFFKINLGIPTESIIFAPTLQHNLNKVWNQG